MKPELNFMYLHSANIGYGYQGIATHKALTEIGVDVFDGLPGSGDLDIADKRVGISSNILFLSTPTHVTGWWDNQTPHLFTMWEGTHLPETFRETLHNFETLLVPSAHCVELYSKYHNNVKYVPLGVDAERWAFQPRKNGMFFNFLVSGSGNRKGNDIVRKAFQRVFSRFDGNGPIPRLIMKDPRGEQLATQDIEVVSGYLTPEAEVELYANAHCYVGASRGEGWGMQPLQAMVQGCPTILTNAHGHTAFAKYGIPISAELTKADYFLFGDAGEWWEPNFDELCERMKWVYENYEFESQQASIHALTLTKEFTWENSAKAIVKTLGIADLLKPITEQGEWYTPCFKRFRVSTIRDWRADIAGVTFFFKKGEDNYVSADVKRILFEGGALDTTCVDGSDGLTENQISRLHELQGVG